MLKTLNIKQFTVFQDARFEFSPGLNVIVGDNGTGKIHVIKLGHLFSSSKPSLQPTFHASTKARPRASRHTSL